MNHIYLLPANGIHCDAYIPLINHLSASVIPIHYPPLASPSPPIPQPLHWEYFRDAIQPHIKGTGNIGIGHSLGGTLLLDHAIRHPHQWSTIIIIDPALFSPTINRMYALLRWFQLTHYVNPMVRLTQRRHHIFSSKPSVFDRWRKNPRFQYMSDTALKIFIDATLVKCDAGYTLRFSKEWEAAIYNSMCTLDPTIWRTIHTLNTVRLVIISGETSNTFLKGAKQQIRPHADQMLTLPNTTHLLPFETPHPLADIIHRYA
ncbi:MAG: alpha/beta fold hydrolase [Candidatus Marinamargulisbacteria bacterium]